MQHTHHASSAIDSNSIMFRSTADDLHRLGSTASESRLRRERRKADSIFLKPKIFESSGFLPTTEAARTPAPNGSSLYSRLSGSIQNLFIGGRGQSSSTSTAVRSSLSKSENNINELSRRRTARDRFLFFGTRDKVRQRRANNFLTSGGGSFFTYNYDEEEESRWKKYFSFKMNLLRKQKAKPDGVVLPKRLVIVLNIDFDFDSLKVLGSIDNNICNVPT